jgi:hypothetical protein
MKKMILAAAFAIAGAIASPAQTMSADIPFAFHVPGAQMPAGKYFIERQLTGAGFTSYIFRAAESTKLHYVAAPILKSTGDHIKTSQLVFRCETEDACQLAEIQSSQSGTRVGVPASLKSAPRVNGTEIAAMFVRVAMK